MWNNFTLTLSSTCVISNSTAAETIEMTDTKLFVSVVTLSAESNEKLLEQLNSSFKRAIKWNKYHTKVSIEGQNQYLDEFINSSFQGVKRPFVLSFENNFALI